MHEVVVNWTTELLEEIRKISHIYFCRITSLRKTWGRLRAREILVSDWSSGVLRFDKFGPSIKTFFMLAEFNLLEKTNKQTNEWSTSMTEFIGWAAGGGAGVTSYSTGVNVNWKCWRVESQTKSDPCVTCKAKTDEVSTEVESQTNQTHDLRPGSRQNQKVNSTSWRGGWRRRCLLRVKRKMSNRHTRLWRRVCGG